MTTTTGACTTGACTTGACNTKAPARRFAPRVPRPVDDDVAQVVRRGACPPRCRSAPSLARPGTLRSRLAHAACGGSRRAPLSRSASLTSLARRPAPASSTGRSTVRTGNHHDHQAGLGVGSCRCHRDYPARIINQLLFAPRSLHGAPRTASVVLVTLPRGLRPLGRVKEWVRWLLDGALSGRTSRRLSTCT